MERYQKLPLSTLIAEATPKPFLELTEQQIEKLKTFSHVLLGILTGVTMLTMIVVAPNALQALELFEKGKGRKKLRHQEKVQKVTRAFYYLKDRGYIRLHRKGDDYEIRLTRFGKKQVKKLDLETLQIPKGRAWDGKFWQIAADIPTKDYKKGADVFRKKIKELGLYPLQRTLWFYPFDPRVEIEFVARSFGIGPFVTVMKIADFDPVDYRALKKHYKQSGLI